MENRQDAKLLRIFVGESDRHGHQPLYEKIVFEAKKRGLCGATVLRGVMGFGADSRIQSAKLFDISSDLPMIVEVVDTEEKIRDFIPVIGAWFEESGSGGLITVEKAEVILYRSGK